MGFTSDGASVMTGSKSGLAERFKGLNPFCLAFHCVAHKLALACASLMKDEDDLRALDKLLQDIANYITVSPKRKHELRELQEEMGERKLTVLKLHG